MDKKTALEALVNITNKNLGTVPSTPSAFDELILKIQKQTGQTISLSSIKRIWGYVKYDSFPSKTILNTLAQFNGFKDWDTFFLSDADKGFDDSGFVEKSVVTADRLNPHDRLLLRWGKGKSCEIECISTARFRVNSSQNIKLEPGDIFTLHIICCNHPIYVTDITRGDLHIPAYIGATKGGISSVTLIPQMQ